GTDVALPAKAAALAEIESLAPARASDDQTIRIISVGALVPRKGYDVLIAALAQITELPWQLLIVGDSTRSPQTAAELAREIARLHLVNRVRLSGVVSTEELAKLYAWADLFAL